MVEGKAWACLYFLNFHEINELMTFPKFLEKSCYPNSFLLSFQDNLLLFTFFYHYINLGVFNHLIMTHHCLCSMDKRGGLHSWKLNGWLWVMQWEVSSPWYPGRLALSYFCCETSITSFRSETKTNENLKTGRSVGSLTGGLCDKVCLLQWPRWHSFLQYDQ